MALGDSYSSGEGDTELDKHGNKHYRAYTDNEEDPTQGLPREKCHLSTRSYPYKLASIMELDTQDWNTVACSGAMFNDYRGEGDYFGQLKNNDDQQTARLLGYNVPSLQATALNEFIPGRDRQIAFVEKYKPKVITLTAGGNDAGFKSVINACVNPTAEFTSTCSYAKDEIQRYFLGQQIGRQYRGLKELYNDLYHATDGQSKIYVIGYPQFVNPAQSNTCGLNVRLNDQERQMIWESVKYMNDVIQAAAEDAGVKYIDIENSFEGHRLCDDLNKYTTGIVHWGTDEQQESFHPNSDGHQAITNKIAQSVNYESLLDYNICPSPQENICPSSNPEEPAIPPYFQTEVENNTRHETMTGRIKKGIITVVSIPTYILGPDSAVQIILYSDPINLGTYTTDSQGSLHAEITIPESVPVGYHTVSVTGTSYSGEPIELWQIVRVIGPDSTDSDEDGILDNTEQCLFIEPSGIDYDIDGLDDSCDPQITAPRDIYRLRAGDPELNYQGSSEHSDYLYLERNIYASAVTGISGDYDPDGNGYAIIAATQNTTPSGRYANLSVDTSSIPNSVLVSFRTPENGCVRYRPTDLSRVTNSSSYRTFAQEATNTNTCRPQPADSDLDSNGQPDDIQPLYMGRNGDPSKGEVVTKLYLLRSISGAEAQLGLSDYAPVVSTAPNPIPVDDLADYRQPWSLLASTQSNPLLAVTYKKIRMIGSTPYVLATSNIGGLCQAWKPGSISTIKQSTQQTTNLTLDTQQTLNAIVGGWCN